MSDRPFSIQVPTMVEVRIYEVLPVRIRKDKQGLRITAKLKHTICVPLVPEHPELEAADAWMKCVGGDYRARYFLGHDEPCCHDCCGLSVAIVARNLQQLNSRVFGPYTFRFCYENREWLIVVDMLPHLLYMLQKLDF